MSCSDQPELQFGDTKLFFFLGGGACVMESTF